MFQRPLSSISLNVIRGMVMKEIHFRAQLSVKNQKCQGCYIRVFL